MARGAIGGPCLRGARLLKGRVSLVELSAYVRTERATRKASPRTNKQHKSIGRSFGLPLDLEQGHARHDGTDKVNVEDGKYVRNVEDYCYGQKSGSRECCHDC